MGQGIEAYRASALVEGFRIRRIYYRAKRPGVTGVLRRGKDLTDGELRALLKADHSEVLRKSQSMILGVMSFGRPELADGCIADLFDFFVACKQLFALTRDANMDPQLRGPFQSFLSENFQMPITHGQLPRVSGDGATLTAHYTLDNPYADQGQRAALIAEEIECAFRA